MEGDKDQKKFSISMQLLILAIRTVIQSVSFLTGMNMLGTQTNDYDTWWSNGVRGTVYQGKSHWYSAVLFKRLS